GGRHRRTPGRARWAPRGGPTRCRGEAMRTPLGHRTTAALRMLVAAALATAAVAGCGSGTGTAPTIEQAPPQTQLNQPVQHVFVIFKENHTYDNFFLSYPNPDEPTPPTQGLAANG